MGYAAAVGTMVLNEVAYVNERSDSRMDAINTDLGRLERDVERGRNRSRVMTNDATTLENRVNAVEGEQIDLGVEQAFMRGEMDRI